MRFVALASIAAACLGAVALAQPPADSPADACCCCDVRRGVIACTHSVKKADCFCAAVECPKSAPTVFDDLPSSTRRGTTASLPPSTMRTVSVPASVPPPPAPPTPLPPSDGGSRARTPTPIPVEQPPHTMPPKEKPSSAPLGCVKTPPARGRQFPCCCCHAGRREVVCEVRGQDDCVCAAVMCPRGAKTVFVKAPACTSS